MTTHDDGTVSFTDVSDYFQIGDEYGADDINKANETVNTLGELVNTNAEDIKGLKEINSGVGFIDTNNIIRPFGTISHTESTEYIAEQNCYAVLFITSYNTNRTRVLIDGFEVASIMYDTGNDRLSQRVLIPILKGQTLKIIPCTAYAPQLGIYGMTY